MVQRLCSRTANLCESGSIPLRVFSGDIAQLVERMLCKHWVIGSIPIVSTLFIMLYALLKDRRRRLLHSLYERRRLLLRSLRENRSLPSRLRAQAYRALTLLPRDSSSTRRRNRCVLTGRSRAILRRFGLSRLRFRSLAREGRLVGVKKASW
jgi:small subunit ribosomal protein S14